MFTGKTGERRSALREVLNRSDQNQILTSTSFISRPDASKTGKPGYKEQKEKSLSLLSKTEGNKEVSLSRCYYERGSEEHDRKADSITGGLNEAYELNKTRGFALC